MRRTGIVFLSLLALGCGWATAAGAQCRLRLATTTSTDNSGLLGALLPPFEATWGCRVDVIAVGTGKALRLGENGDVDVVLVHARPAEDRFVAAGFGINRRDVMHNDFVVLGPPADPAGVRGAASGAEALARVARAGASFVSRGDDSGTHKKEKSLWQASGVAPGGGWYKEAGQGMGAVLRMADELGAYTLSDRGTYLAFRDKLSLAVLHEGDAALANPYGIIPVNPARHPGVNYEAAMALVGFVTGPRGQRIIREFRKGGEALFFPDAIPNP
ncbi:MAG: substrate-binding domain-containing protein [Deferrisomatales bacterium]